MAKRSYRDFDDDDNVTFERNYKRRNVRRSLESYESDYEMSDGEDSFSSRLNSSGELVNFMMKTDGEHCYGCGDLIHERYLLRVGSQSWHLHCLRCCVCQTALDRQHTCFIKQDHIYCKMDYARQFGAKCAKCLRNIQPTDWVRRAKEYVYHLACFACDNCKRQLSTGEEFALHDSRVLCKTHYVELIEGGPNKDSDSNSKNKTKRVRTTFTDEQLQVLQANFQLDSNPDGQDLERIAQITGLSKRVTQVWFQNSRARQKKHQTGPCTSVSGSPPVSGQSVMYDDGGCDWSNPCSPSSDDGSCLRSFSSVVYG